MEEIKFKSAFYIKLGKNGKWADESIDKGIVRVGWGNIDLEDIKEGHWDKIKTIIRNEFKENSKKNGATQDYNALKLFCEATKDDVFITFHKGKMHWCCLDGTPVYQDETSKYRKTIKGWSHTPLNNSLRILHSNEVSGEISKTQAFQATLCQYKPKKVEIINRIINGVPNPIIIKIREKKQEICELTTRLIKDMHWKDCEILTDLIFQQSGWHRVSMQGGSMEFGDMEYLDPINNERYIVQVKSGATLAVFKDYESRLKDREYKKMFFVVFHPDNALENYANEKKDIEILFGDKLSELIIDLGLLEWVLKKSF